MNWKEHIGAAAAITGTGAGFCLASGRAQAVFYAQMKEASWLGILAAGLFYALFTAMTVRLARRTGAADFPDIYRRLLGCRAGRWIGMLYGFALVTGSVLQLLTAANAGAPALPVSHAAVAAGLLALGLSLLIAAMGKRALTILCGSYLVLLLLFQAALWKWGSVPEDGLNFAVNLRLEGLDAAAVLLGLLHACVCGALSAGVAVRFSGSRTRPWCMGACCGAMLALQVSLGNGILLCRDERLLALQSPFSALASAWGSIGFHACAALVFLGAVSTLSGIAFLTISGGSGRKMLEN